MIPKNSCPFHGKQITTKLSDKSTLRLTGRQKDLII